mmetsp:Transcript_31102/g.91049  ORF Transcript_31102/g.91049 Transcript_31102/m.91049 type:complete len:166 (-) Transcript_31102:831-1328(-)
MVRMDHRTSRRKKNSCGRAPENNDSGAAVRRKRTRIGGASSMAATSKRGGTDNAGIGKRLYVTAATPPTSLVLDRDVPDHEPPASLSATTADGVSKIRLAVDLKRGLPVVAGVAEVDGTGRFRCDRGSGVCARLAPGAVLFFLLVTVPSTSSLPSPAVSAAASMS